MRPGLWLSAAAAAALLASGCGPTCELRQTSVENLCVPQPAAAGQALTLEVVEGCGSCGDEEPSCRASMAGQDIHLTVETLRCEEWSLFPVACPAVCRMLTVRCEVPALQAGDYTVYVNGRAHPMRVEAAGESSCAVSAPG